MQNTIEKWTKSCIFLFSKKGDLRITKNYRSITFLALTAKVYNALLLNHIKPKTKKILRIFKTILGEIDQQLYRFWLSIEVMCAKKSLGNIIVCRFLQGIWFNTKREDRVNTTGICSSHRNCYSYKSAL